MIADTRGLPTENVLEKYEITNGRYKQWNLHSYCRFFLVKNFVSPSGGNQMKLC